VTSQPLGIACATDCTQRFGAGRVVTLGATPVAGAVFAGWTGACAGAGTAPACTIAIGSDLSVGASFADAPAPPVVTPPAPRPPATPPAQPAPRVTLTHLKIVPSTLHRARKADKRRGVKARRATRAKVSLELSRGATLTVTVATGRKGVRRGSQCVAPPRKASAKDRPCTRYVTRPGQRTVKLAAGAHSFTLTPLFADHTLAAGSYRLALVALDTSANRVGPVSKPFRVVR
jgi:hypothetical protein